MRKVLIARLFTTVCLALIFFVLQSAPVSAVTSIHVGDKLSVTTYNHSEMSGLYIVDSLGEVSLPIAGSIKVSGLSPTEAQRAIERKLAHLLFKPTVAVFIAEASQNIFVTGADGSILSYVPGMRLSNAVALIKKGTTTQNAGVDRPQSTNKFIEAVEPQDYKHLLVIRDNHKLGPYDVSSQQDAILQSSDTIFVPFKQIAVKVTGEVNSPQTSYLTTEEPISNAITQAGGTTNYSSFTNVQLVRNGITHTYPLGAVELQGAAKQGDALVVTRAPHIDVLGLVVKPGELFLRGDATVLSALYSAGGIVKHADLRHVHVIRRGDNKEFDLTGLVRGKADQNPNLKDGDVVFVPTGGSSIDFSTVFAGLLTTVGIVRLF